MEESDKMDKYPAPHMGACQGDLEIHKLTHETEIHHHKFIATTFNFYFAG